MEPTPDDLNEMKDVSPLELEVPVQRAAESWTTKAAETLSFFWFGKREYMMTPMIVNINLAFFLIIIGMGAAIFLPFSERVLSWGYYFRRLPLRIEWWRLLVSIFVHADVLPLAINMAALISIGIVLEPILGKTRFVTAYLLSGIIGSVTSLAWQEMSISIGASGAICGMYGAFFALCTVRRIKELNWTALLILLAFFIAYQIFTVYYEDADLAASLGGLAAGLLIGYAYAPSLKIPGDMRLQRITTIGISIFILTVASAVYANTSNDAEEYDKNLKHFMECESAAINAIIYHKDPRVPPPFHEKGVPAWRAALKCLDAIDSLYIAPPLKKRNVLLRRYCEIRIQTYETYQRMYAHPDTSINAECRLNERRLTQVMNELSGKARGAE